MLLYEHTIDDMARGYGGHVLVRKQNCYGCHKVLAIEITGTLGRRGDYYVVKGMMRTRFGNDLLYGKEVWFGNFTTCPNCGRSGKLPMDKPLAAEEIAKPKEGNNAKNKKLLKTKKG